MATDKKSFVLYCDLIHTLKKMPKDKVGELFLHILSYVNDENPQTEDVLIDLVFEPIKQQFKRDLKKYEKTKDRNRENISKRWNKEIPLVENDTKNTTGISGINKLPLDTKHTDNDNDNDNGNGNDNGNDNVTDILLKKETKESIPPALAKTPEIDFVEIGELFNKMCPKIPSVEKITDSRKTALKNRIDEVGLEGLGDVFRMVAESDYLNGLGRNKWVATFDWIIQPANFIKIREGNYKNNENGIRDNNPAAADNQLKKSANDAVDAMFGLPKSG